MTLIIYVVTHKNQLEMTSRRRRNPRTNVTGEQQLTTTSRRYLPESTAQCHWYVVIDDVTSMLLT